MSPVVPATPGVLLSIAGTDPSGAAGIQVDLQVFRDFGFHGASVITAVVWQNTSEVRGFRALERDEVAAQLDAVLDDIPISAVKIGMVPDEAIAYEIAVRLEPAEIPVVVDTVFTSGSGAVGLTNDRPLNVAELLFPLATVATPNAREAAVIVGREVTVENGPEVATEIQRRFGVDAVLLKAGHLEGAGEIRDVLATAADTHWMKPLSRVPDDVRGTGCQLSSAIAARLAAGSEIEEACESARHYLNDLLLRRRFAIGNGRKVVVRDGEERD